MREHRYLTLGPGGFRRVAYVEHGDGRTGPVAICVHGLTRNGRDFDFLAGALTASHRVVCPDVVGRGRSDWLADGAAYGYPVYLADMAALIAHLDCEAIDWIGTSMGGLIGMLLAGQPNSPIRRLVLNDIGPFIPKAALERIGRYAGVERSFASLDETIGYLREIQAGWGPLTDGQWRHLARHGVRQDADGRWRLGHDPAIGRALGEPRDIDLWPAWEAVRCPVLLLRGAQSDVLRPETVSRMRQAGPPLEVVEFAGIGHAPALMESDQIGVIRDWLAG